MNRLLLQVIFVFSILGVLPAWAGAPKEAQPSTIEANERLLNVLPFADEQDFEDAMRGFIAPLASPVVTDAQGRFVYNLKAYDFIKAGKAPSTVNPSLWRQARLNMIGGLFKVTDRIYQVRALDISNMTIIEGDTGLIIIDPLLSKETAAAALALYYDNAEPFMPVSQQEEPLRRETEQTVPAAAEHVAPEPGDENDAERSENDGPPDALFPNEAQEEGTPASEEQNNATTPAEAGPPNDGAGSVTPPAAVAKPRGSEQPVKRRPVVAVIYTHSHTDHYGGVKGVISEDEVAAGKVSVLAPEGFMEAAVSENVLAGNAMSRRATYMYGTPLPRGEQGQVDVGLGKATSSGELTLIAPTDVIRTSGETRTIDGVVIEFQMAPETEAPAEMLMYFPQFKALCAAEDATHTMHNLYTLRGAQVRDANKWWKALDYSVDTFSDRTEVVFAQHHWPRWGREAARSFLTAQRNAYKYLHDQTLRLANHGHTPKEISEMLSLPATLANQWHLRDYYGTIKHNVKAVYQRYLGWYDGHPANLNPLPPVDAARRYVDYMGGSKALMVKARESFAKGEFRWVAEVLKHAVFADPEDVEARKLQADALEQLGYQAESGPWRNVYLMGAYELRHGIPARKARGTASQDTVAAMSSEMVLDYMAVRLKGPEAEDTTLRINWIQPDTDEVFAVSIEDAVLLYKKDKPFARPDAVLRLPRSRLAAVVSGQSTLEAESKAGHMEVEGNVGAVSKLFSLLDSFEMMFNIVTP